MHTQNLLIDQSSNWKTIEHIGEYFPELNGVPAFALIVKTINPVNLSALMIASQKKEVFWVLDFVAHQQSNRLNRLLASVNIIT
jgi:hypothetical protein